MLWLISRKDYPAMFESIARAVARPIVTIIFAAVIAQVIIERIPIPEYQWAVLVGVVLWWFGDRTAQHVKGKAATDAQDSAAASGKDETAP